MHRRLPVYDVLLLFTMSSEQDIDNFEELFQDIEEIMGEDSDDSGAMPTTLNRSVSPGKVVTIEMITRVLDAIKSDEILPTSMRTAVSSTQVDELTSKLEQLNDILPVPAGSGIFSSAVKEKAWHKFHSMLPALKASVDVLFDNMQLSALVCLQAAEEMLKDGTSEPQSSSSDAAEGLTSNERDIISYVAGFVLFRCQKKFGAIPSIITLIEKLKDKDGNSKLISVKSRGGLVQPISAFIDFVMLLEFIFRNLCNAATVLSVPSLQLFTDSVCQNETVVSVFYKCTYHTDTDSSSQEKLMLFVLSLFHKVRCHAKCRQTMEKYLVKTKTARKQKSLRKSID